VVEEKEQKFKKKGVFSGGAAVYDGRPPRLTTPNRHSPIGEEGERTERRERACCFLK